MERRGIKIPIIVVTAVEDGRQMFAQHDIHDLLQKPVDPRAVLDFVEQSIRPQPDRAA